MNSAQIEKTVDELRLIEGLPPKSGEKQTDPHAAAIVALGQAAGPYLVAKLTDDSPSRVAYGFRYSIGDVALALLDEIYQPPYWPSPDGSVVIPTRYGDFRDYVAFVHSRKGRRQLQKSWKVFIKK
ncbi:MAG: hypothetical protein ACR2JB_24785 [Bryobacteraceae bacterium]